MSADAEHPAPVRRRGMSVRLRLTLSYAVFLMVAGALLLSVVWLFLLRYVPSGPIDASAGFVPNRSDLLRAFAPAAAAALAFLLVIGLIASWFLAGRMLAPLVEIRDVTRHVRQGSLSHRVRMAGPQDEFRELADAVDAMLARIEDHVAQQQRFAANASHELRTPLAITQTLLDVARRDPSRDVDALLGRLQHVNSRAIQLADALLQLSRADQVWMTGERVDLALVAEEAAEDLLPLAERRGIALDVSGESAVARGTAALLHQMAANLVHNAIVHNLADGGRVSVSTHVRGGEATLRVENTGADLAHVSLAALAEPFQRGRGRVQATGSDHAGTGLGLAIVQHIVDAHRGRLRLTAREGGGAIVEVRLPGA